MLISLLRSSAGPKEIAFNLILYFLALSLAFAGHEFAHALAAHLVGDDTAKNRGRLTLNPLAHFDLIGMASLILLGFGWGKPVPVNPNNFTKFNKRLSGVIVDLAGVFANFVMAFITAIGSAIALKFGIGNMWFILLAGFFELSYKINITLLAFNLLPIPPLDGFNFWINVLPVKFRYTNFFKYLVTYGPKVLMILIIAGLVFGVQVLPIILSFISGPFEFVIHLVVVLIASL